LGSNRLGSDRLAWWEEAVVYQIYPRSFCDTDGDGVGDIEGVRRHLDHLCWLGVDAVWLSPFYPSPMADFGYDVADYCDVDPLFGDLAALEGLIGEAHSRGIRFLVDWVPNHTSSAHPWFGDARSARSSARRDWYIWRDDRPDSAGGNGPPGSPGRLPNNWRAAFAGVGGGDLPPAWTWDARSAQWYLHLFLPAQPDLNWANPALREAMVATLRFWLDRGVDGFRVDVVHGLGKDPDLADLPAETADVAVAAINDRPETHPYVAQLREVIDAYGGDRMMVGEVYLPTTAQVATYHGSPGHPELHLSFNFPPLFAPWDAGVWRQRIDEVVDLIEGVGAWPTWVLSNHDNPRHRTRYGSERRARAAAVLLLTLRGTPFLYAGEELGLEDAVVPPERRVDPGGRDGPRAPLPWDGSAGHGWVSGAEPWLPWPPGAATRRTVSGLRHDPTSILGLYRRILTARRASDALRRGSLQVLDSPDGMIAYRRQAGADQRAVAVNFTDAPLPLPGALTRDVFSAQHWVVEVASSGDGEGRPPGPVDGDSAVILRPDQAPST